jgi:hypothetical protein
MAFIFETNIWLGNAGDVSSALFHLKEQLKLAGWTVPQSSDGITYNPTGDQITVETRDVPGGINFTAWFVVQSPEGHAWMFWDNIPPYATETIWTVRVSRAGFTGGSPDANTPPSATDEGTLSSGLSGNALRYNIGAEDTDQYRFWASPLHSDDVVNTGCVVMMDTLAPTVGAALDPDPFVYVLCSGGEIIPFGYTRTDTTDERFARLNMLAYGEISGQALWPGLPQYAYAAGSGSNQYNGKDDLAAVVYGAISNRGQGSKGISTMLRYTSNNRNPGTVLTKTTPGDLITIGSSLIAPWNGSLPKRDV